MFNVVKGFPSESTRRGSSGFRLLYWLLLGLHKESGGHWELAGQAGQVM